MLDQIEGIFEEISGKSVLVSFHKNADPDAIASAVGLIEILKEKYHCKVRLIYDELNKVSAILLQHIDLDLDVLSDKIEDYEYVILVDTNNLVQISDSIDRKELLKKKIIIIDHHAPHNEIENFCYKSFINPSYPSTSEMIYKISEILNFNLTSHSKFLLLAGVTYDSRHFIIAKKDTFRIAYNLINEGVDYQKIIELLHQPKQLSEKIARLKTAKRMEIFEIGGKWLLTISKVSSFEASASRSLIELGADIAIVLNIDKDEVRISARSTNEFFNETNFHLGKDLMEPIGPIIKGEGGGHTTAAGCNGRENADKAIKEIMEIIKKRISPSIKKIVS
ncbi:MAG: DHH family phosphoesterase [Candidatus Odinarchaeia archaeon]